MFAGAPTTGSSVSFTVTVKLAVFVLLWMSATVTNTGVAPIYHDAFIAVNGVRARESLKRLLPGDKLTVLVESGGPSPKLTIESDRLVPGQRIEYEADLAGKPEDKPTK